MANSAHIYKSRSGNWNISFHHPICREGSIGKKIHRSLKVSDESGAQALGEQMNTLLALAETPTLLPTRSHAIAERKYARVIIDAFFDCMTPEPVDYFAQREREMPLPTREGKRKVPHMLIVGPTGAGKSRFIQHLLQTTRENFPMRGAGRTTVADTEIIVDDVDYSAVVTFYSENEIREIIKENVLEACAFAYREEEDKAKIASKLLVDSDKRFRFNHVIGEWMPNTPTMDDEDEFGDEEQESELDTDVSTPATWTKLESCVAQVLSMTELALKTARHELQPETGQDELVVEEYWLQYIEQDQLDALTEEILEELERRLCAATGQSSWPVTYRVADTSNKVEFFRRLRPFYQNNRKLFGALVTPLVQGIRVRGRFTPPFFAATKLPTWVLLDGQGVGHEQGGATKINRTVPPELAKKFSGADLICLVDRAVPAMTGDAPILLESLIVRGHQDRLAMIFTHFEDVAAPDLNSAGRKTKVLEGLSNAIQAIVSLPKAQRVLLERTAESKSYFLARMDQSEVKLRSTQSEMKRICEHFERSIGETEPPKFRPLFNEYAIVNVLRGEIEAYRRDWSEAELASYNWKIMQALTNWIGHAYSDGYPKRNLYPGQDLSQRLVAAVSIELESPTSWEPYKPNSADEESRILNSIRREVGDRIDAYCREVLVRDPRTGFWLPAYENISGPGTKVRRARTVARILEDRAQLPDEGLGGFTKDIWHIVEEAIAQTCLLSANPEVGVSATFNEGAAVRPA
jgi:hypothetical protein